MPFNTVGSKIFIFSQFLVIVVAISGILFFVFRKKKRERAGELKPELIPTRVNVTRTPIRAETVKPDVEPPKALSSALPTWDVSTPPHDILGVHPQSPEDVIEKAYKKLLKQYHPDRVAHWGQGYQSRAHQVVLLIQAARDKMIGKK